MDSLFIIDGYNLMHKFSENTSELEDLRDELINLCDSHLASIGGFGILVFDAYNVKESDYREGRISNRLELVYSKHGESADNYIEKKVKELNLYKDINVVSDDGMIQSIVFSLGAKRITCKEFLKDFKGIANELKAVNNSVKNSKLFSTLDVNTVRKLEELRKGNEKK